MAEVIIYQVGEQHFRFSTRIHRWHPHVFHGVNDASIERKTSQHLTKIIIDPWNHHLTYLSPCESLKISQNFPGTRAPGIPGIPGIPGVPTCGHVHLRHWVMEALLILPASAGVSAMRRFGIKGDHNGTYGTEGCRRAIRRKAGKIWGTTNLRC